MKGKPSPRVQLPLSGTQATKTPKGGEGIKKVLDEIWRLKQLKRKGEKRDAE